MASTQKLQGDTAITAGTAARAPVPKRLGRYALQEKIGFGGFAEVHLAFDPLLNRSVAIKVPRVDRPISPEALQAFQDEAKRVAALDIPGVIPIYDVGEDQGHHFLVMKLMPRTLASIQPSLNEAIRLIKGLASTLHQVHLQGLVHRDIKPANILLDDEGRVYLADFGLATTEEELVLEPRGRLGSVIYMSPEQATCQSHLVDSRTDVYSLGVVLYELLTGRPPFVATTADEYLESIVRREPRPLTTINDAIPAELEAICLKCLRKPAHERYSSCRELKRALVGWEDSVTTSSDSASIPKRFSKVRFGVLAAVLLSIAIGIYASLLSTSWDRGNDVPALSIEPSPPNSVADRFVRALGMPPKEIIWPGYRGIGSFQFNEAADALEVSSNSVRLIELGSIEGSISEVSIEMEQPIWLGGCGIFLGHQFHNLGHDSESRFHIIWLVKSETETGAVQYQIHHWLVQMRPDIGMLNQLTEVQVYNVPDPRLAKSTRLTVRVRDGQVEQIRWGEQALPYYWPGFDVNTLPTAAGTWGAFQLSGSSWFRNPKQIMISDDSK